MSKYLRAFKHIESQTIKYQLLVDPTTNQKFITTWNEDQMNNPLESGYGNYKGSYVELGLFNSLDQAKNFTPSSDPPPSQ